jgi:hypothetical protein
MARFLIGASLLVILAAACASTPAQPSTSPTTPTTTASTAANGDDCGKRQSAALDIVSQAIDANRACTQDGDCVIVSLGAGCVDACGRVMAASGKAAYDKAVADANAQYCDSYKSAGCPGMVPPPCAPNPPPSCKAGTCQ